MKNEAFIDRIFRGYGEARFGKEAMDGVTSVQVEAARCKAMKALDVLTEKFGKQPKGTAENLFCAFVASEYLSEKTA